MVKFIIDNKGRLVGQVGEKEYKKIDMNKTALKVTATTVRGKDGKAIDGFVLTNKKGKRTPVLKSIQIDMEHPAVATTTRCLCEVLPTKKGELSYVYVNLQTGDISTTFNTVGRGTLHKNDYVLDANNTIQSVHDNLSMTPTEYAYASKLTATDNKVYTKDTGFVVKHIPTGKYGVISTFGNPDGDIKVFCPPVFDTDQLGHRTISTDKYNFLYEYYSGDTRVLADICYGLALQKVGAKEEFRVGKNIQQYRANHPLVIEAREKASTDFTTKAHKKATPQKKMSIVERIKARDREVKIAKAITRSSKPSVADVRPTEAFKHVAEGISQTYPTRAPYEYRNMIDKQAYKDMCDIDEMV